MDSTTAADQVRLQALFDHGHDVVMFLKPDGDIVWASPSLPRLLGWSAADLIGSRLSAIIHPDALEATRQWRNRVFAAEEGTPDVAATSDPLRMRRQDGEYRWCTLSMVRTFDDRGIPTGISALLHDVDDLVETRLRAERGAAELNALVDAQVEPHVLFRAVRGDDGRILDFEFQHANRAAADFEGRPLEDILGRRMLEVLPDPEEAIDDIADCCRVLATGEPVVWNEVPAPGYLGPDGTPKVLDIRITKVGEDLVSFAYRDISDLHRDRVALAEANTLLRGVFESMIEPHAVLRAVRDEHGVAEDFLFEDINEAGAAFEGYPRGVLIGATIKQLYRDPVEARNDVGDCARVLATGLPHSQNDVPSNNYTDGEGRPVYTDIRIVPVDADRVSYAWRDVSARHRAQAQIEESEQRFRMLAESMSDVVILVRDGVVQWVSPSVHAAAGYSVEELVGISPVDLVHPDDLGLIAEKWPGANAILPRLRYRLRAKDGGYHWVDAEGRVTIAADGARVSVVSTRVVDAEVEALTALEDMAKHDELTGLVNRHEVFRHLERAVSGPVRTGTRVAMAFCDLDGFKEVNDVHGHSAGDTLLRSIARRLERAVRSGDVVARIGGDELLVVLNGVHDIDDALRIAEKLRGQIRLPTPIPGGAVTVSASIGVTMAEHGESVDEIVARADAAMYQAKKGGKDRVVVIPLTPGP